MRLQFYDHVIKMQQARTHRILHIYTDMFLNLVDLFFTLIHVYGPTYL